MRLCVLVSIYVSHMCSDAMEARQIPWRPDRLPQARQNPCPQVRQNPAPRPHRSPGGYKKPLKLEWQTVVRHLVWCWEQ